jgi:hypothetical protein
LRYALGLGFMQFMHVTAGKQHEAKAAKGLLLLFVPLPAGLNSCPL